MPILVDQGERVTNFLIADPSIEEIFIEKVGRAPAPVEERHLAHTEPPEQPAASSGVAS